MGHLEENKTRSQISKIITTGFNAINLIYFFTAGPDEVRCWTIQKHWLAPQAAGRIHTDMEKGFICAEIIHWADFECLGSEVKCREEGKLHQQGRTYEMMDGDICFFKFNPQGRQEVDDVVTQCLVCSCVGACASGNGSVSTATVLARRRGQPGVQSRHATTKKDGSATSHG